MAEQQMKYLIRKLYEVGSKFDIAYLHAVTNKGDSSLTGEEYEDLSDVLIEAEEFLGIE